MTILETEVDHFTTAEAVNMFESIAFEQEMAAVIEATAIEREWMEAAGASPFQSDEEILKAVEAKKLQQVKDGVGFLAVKRLTNWRPERSDPSHQHHYSPPYLKPEAMQVLGLIGHQWARELSWEHRLPVTSTIRSTSYQQGLANKEGKLALNPEIGWSTHVYGYAFDIDACGLYLAHRDRDVYKRHDDKTNPYFIAANPRTNPGHEEIIRLGKEHLTNILGTLASDGIVNVADEYSGTNNNCYHVAVNPQALR